VRRNQGRARQGKVIVCTDVNILSSVALTSSSQALKVRVDNSYQVFYDQRVMQYEVDLDVTRYSRV